jgi:hypothetical protein
MVVHPSVDHLIPEARSTINASDIDIRPLCQLLHLSGIERKVLLLAFRAKVEKWIVDHGSPWRIRFGSEHDALCGLAELIDEPTNAVTACFAPPCLLQGLGLLDLCSYCPRTLLIDFLGATSQLMDLLTNGDRSETKLLDRLHQVPMGIEVMRRHPPPLELLYEWYPLPLAQAYERAMAGRPTTGQDVAVLASWLSGCEYSTAECQTLAGRLGFNDIQQVIHQITLSRCLAGQVVTRARIFEGLCAAAR